MFYSNCISGTMQAKLEELALNPSDTRNNLDPELDIARLMASEGVKLFQATHYGKKEVSPALKLQAQFNLRDAIGFVAEIAVKNARIRQIKTDTIAATDLDYFVRQISRIIEQRVLPLTDEETVSALLEEVDLIYVPTSTPQETGQQEAAKIREFLSATRAATAPKLIENETVIPEEELNAKTNGNGRMNGNGLYK